MEGLLGRSILSRFRSILLRLEHFNFLSISGLSGEAFLHFLKDLNGMKCIQCLWSVLILYLFRVQVMGLREATSLLSVHGSLLYVYLANALSMRPAGSRLRMDVFFVEWHDSRGKTITGVAKFRVAARQCRDTRTGRCARRMKLFTLIIFIRHLNNHSWLAFG